MRSLEDKHKYITNNYKAIKTKYLERLGTKMLKNEEKFNKLKEKKLSTNFLNIF
jgi:hypothetical protein